MNKETLYTAEEIQSDKMLTLTNRHVNIAYIMAFALQQSCEDMDVYLNKTHTNLARENKALVNELLKASKRIQYLVNELEARSVLKMDSHDSILHDTFGFMFYSILMHFLSILGTDNCKPKAWYLYKQLKRYEHLIDFPKLKTLDSLAWGSIIDSIEKGEYVEIKLEKKAYEDNIKESRG